MNRPHQKGSAFVYILVAIALLAALTTTFMSSSSQQKTAQDASKITLELKAQIDFIRGAIQECVLMYPAGDIGYTGVGTKPYPLQPSNPYLASPVGGGWLPYIRCPGNPGNSNNHAPIFGGTTGKFMPEPPKGFNRWWYENGPDGVYMDISTSRTDPFILTAFEKLDEMFAECEADVIDARSGLQVISTTGDNCPAGNICFRVRFVTKPSAVYQAGRKEALAGCPNA
jgi:hypothetical protein